jgi:hypothetical protein
VACAVPLAILDCLEREETRDRAKVQPRACRQTGERTGRRACRHADKLDSSITNNEHRKVYATELLGAFMSCSDRALCAIELR